MISSATEISCLPDRYLRLRKRVEQNITLFPLWYPPRAEELHTPGIGTIYRWFCKGPVSLPQIRSFSQREHYSRGHHGKVPGIARRRFG